ncbi:hypothetical protein QE364_003911 [Nocardioides zeae]|uniref:Uncharacterized protein n=1 Tax=Nocardioides zeae TaxID=1457234 RepID=A0ACC6IN53_9ACTN|nr:hypothetical protein [Nocardioides zeae]MDR6212180.1 hypothetical protein [Nocardioides zeae]
MQSGDVAGFAFGLGLYVLALNYVRYGPEGVRGWFSAKLINEPYQLRGDKLVKPGAEAEDATPSSSTTREGLTTTRPTVPTTI